MLKEPDAVKLIFGLKVQQLRREHNLSYHQLSERTGLAISYLHNIEKGKKYPKTDKILALARALEVDYNYLVSLNGDKKLKPIIDLLNSDFLKIFPLDLFGINTAKLLELLAHTPDKVNAFLSTVINIIRNYRLRGEDFYRAALRSYQGLYDNYFAEIEAAVLSFRQRQQLPDRQPLSSQQLRELLLECFGIQTDRRMLPGRPALQDIRSYYSPRQKTLFINGNLSREQENFLLAKELGFQFMQMEERPLETRMLEFKSFDRLLNNFKASYFSGALLIPEEDMIADIRQMSTWKEWDTARFLGLLDKYAVTPEILLQRMANMLPRHFGVKDAFFLRFFSEPGTGSYVITKEIHLSQLQDPHASHVDEHYCRRWVSIDLIRQVRTQGQVSPGNVVLAAAQVSRYWNTPNAYLCFCLAKPGTVNSASAVSVTLGLLMNDHLQKLFPFLEDPNLLAREVSITCERCGIQDCELRAYPPVHLHWRREQERIRAGLAELEKEGL